MAISSLDSPCEFDLRYPGLLPLMNEAVCTPCKAAIAFIGCSRGAFDDIMANEIISHRKWVTLEFRQSLLSRQHEWVVVVKSNFQFFFIFENILISKFSLWSPHLTSTTCRVNRNVSSFKFQISSKILWISLISIISSETKIDSSLQVNRFYL